MQQSLYFRLSRSVAPLLAAILTSSHAGAVPPSAHEPTHVVREGETLSAIALQHHISISELRAANRLSDNKALRVGQTLAVPVANQSRGASSTTLASTARAVHLRSGPRMKAGIVRLVRGSETLQTRVLDRRRQLVANKLPEFARLLRAGSGAQHDIDPRLVTLIAMISDHFGGREIVVVSGFRPYTSRQFTAHSNHNAGRAMDFTIPGVSNESLRDFCRTFRNVGVGYYPNSSFVHLDVRPTSTYWVDYAGPGQAPRYHRAESKNDADEGAGEVEDVPSVDDPAGTKNDPTSKACDPRGTVQPNRTTRDSTGTESVFPGR